MKEFIEIPFGAKNSELCGWEYTIPKGFVASIENGKIVVKKEENKDEKIRNEICIYIGAKQDISLDTHNRWLTWLEKQGEQKPAWSEEDERMCQETIDWFEKICFPYALESENPARESIKWLKSLKDRVQPQWKPSDEQMDALETAVSSLQSTALESLYNELKKL